MPDCQPLKTDPNNDDDTVMMEVLKTKLPRILREQLNEHTQTQAYFLLAMLSDDACIKQLHARLQKQYTPAPSMQTPLEQALALVAILRHGSAPCCSPQAPFKYRLPSITCEFPIHGRRLNHAIHQFNQLIEAYYASACSQALDGSQLETAYQAILDALQKYHMGCNIQSVWQLLKAMSAWSTVPMENLLNNHPLLLATSIETSTADQTQATATTALPTEPVSLLSASEAPNKQTTSPAFTPSFNYPIDAAGRLAKKSHYLLLNGFALKPGGHADALAKHAPNFMPWDQLQNIIRRQLSHHMDIPLNDLFFYWLQSAMQNLGIEFIAQGEPHPLLYVSPFLQQHAALTALNEEAILHVLQEQLEPFHETDLCLDASHLQIISRFLMMLLHEYQFNRGQALGIGANWDGTVSHSNEAGADAFRFNDTDWAAQFKHLSQHRQGPAEAHMNASIGIQYEFGALASNFDYMTQLQPSEYEEVIYNALIDNLVSCLLPEPAYCENQAYKRFRRHDVVTHLDDDTPQMNSFYQADAQGTYFQTKKGDYKQTPMFRQAGSLEVVPFPRDAGSGDCSQSLSIANPLWPLQLQYAQSCRSGERGNMVYNPIGPDTFIPDTFYGQVIRESNGDILPFIGVVPKNFDAHFKQEKELCASFVIRMLQSSRLMVYCPAFQTYDAAIKARFLPPIGQVVPELPSHLNADIQHKWHTLNNELQNAVRSTATCHKAFFSLFKACIYSLYPLAKDDKDIHYYFVHLLTETEAFNPQNRATCERFIRELTTRKPLFTQDQANNRQQYEASLNYLSTLTQFFYPKPCDETAKAIASQARLHVKPLLALAPIKEYFADLSRHYQANLSRKVTPGMLHDAIKYQRPSPQVGKDLYHRRHGINFFSGYRDVEGNQIVQPSSRETLLDKTVKTVGAILPMVYRNKTPLSVLTQPFAQAYIAGKSAKAEEQSKLLTGLAGVGGFVYGVGLGITNTLATIPRAVYNGLSEPVLPPKHSDHVLNISAAPSNEPGLLVQAIMAIRDQFLQLLTTPNMPVTVKQSLLLKSLLSYVKRLHPDLLADSKMEAAYHAVLLQTFPLRAHEWESQCGQPQLIVQSQKLPDSIDILSKHALQIDRTFIYALYECLTAPSCEQAATIVLKTVIEKYKLKEPQDKALTEVFYDCIRHPEIKKQAIAQCSFHGPILQTLQRREHALRQIQMWLNDGLDEQWGLQTLLPSLIQQDITLATTITRLPNCIKEPLYVLLLAQKEKHPRSNITILNDYQLEQAEKNYILSCATSYQTLTPAEKDDILTKIYPAKPNPLHMSKKAYEHLKLTQFVRREWRHQLLTQHEVQAIVTELKSQCGPSWFGVLDGLSTLYNIGLADIHNPKRFDLFYEYAKSFSHAATTESSLHAWVNVTMNAHLNLLLDTSSMQNSETIRNPLKDSPVILTWLHQLHIHQHGLRTLLAQQIEQASSFDLAAWRCQLILQAVEAKQPNNEPIRDTGMQKLLRMICLHPHDMTITGAEQAKTVPVKAYCRHSTTMQHAWWRVKAKLPEADCVRRFDVRGQ